MNKLINYGYSYSGGPSAKNEVKTLDGVTRGSYSYIDSNAQLQTVNYVADSLGFRVAATNLPQQVVDTNAAPVDNAQPPKQVEDTPEVQQARAEHLAAVAKARSESSGIELEAPEPVEDTEEVKQAREEHLQAVEEAKARNAQAPSESVEILSQPQLIQVPAAVHLTHAPIAYINAQPATGFAYTVLAPGHHHLSQVIAA